MKICTHILAIVLTLFFNQVSAQQNENSKSFELAWKIFANAVIDSNTSLLAKLSLDTIKCPLCAENTELERQAMNKIRFTKSYPDTLYSYLAKIPTELFFKNELYSFFNDKTIKNLINLSKISFSNLDSLDKICEVHVLADDPLYKAKGEDLQWDFQFQFVDNEYKFVAFYTTP